MNAKIKQLAEQAGFIGENMYPIFGTCQETALNNFAQLLITECSNIAFKSAPSDESACDISEAIEQAFERRSVDL